MAGFFRIFAALGLLWALSAPAQAQNPPTVKLCYGIPCVAVTSTAGLPVTIVSGGGGGLSVTDQTAWTNASSAFTPTGGVYNDSATALSSGNEGTVRLNANREMHVTCDASNTMCALLSSSIPVNVSSVATAVTGFTVSSHTAIDMNQHLVNGLAIATAANGTAKVGVVGNAGGAFDAATGAAPPANVLYMGANTSGATGGLLAGLKTCDSHAKYDASDNGSITLVTGVASRKVYVCGYILATGGTATNLKLREGSDANCATNAADLTPAWQLVANDKIGMQSSFWTGLAVSTNAYYVCVNASAGNAHQAEIWYTIQ